jgi:antitoxin component YwqK of YwqJK toxin-antitoxin module
LYDENGNVTQSGEFQQGRLYDGKWYRYNGDGLLIRIETSKAANTLERVSVSWGKTSDN